MRKIVRVAIAAALLIFGVWCVVAKWLEPAPLSAPQAAPVAAAVVPAASLPSPPPLRDEVIPPPSPEPSRQPGSTPAAVGANAQLIRCIDEFGQPVAGADVCLLRNSVSGLHACSDAEGRAVFAEVAPGAYWIRAQAGWRHHLPESGGPGRTMPSPAFDIVLRELWIGGLYMPDTEAVTSGARSAGFLWAHMGGEELEVAWKVRCPGAVFWVMFRDPRCVPSDTLEVRVEWFGHALHEQTLRMWPASAFTGPERVEPTAVPLRDWARVRIVLIDLAGQALPDVVQTALRQNARLDGTPGARRSGMDNIYTFGTGTAVLPTGDYELQLLDGNSHMVPAARCSVARDTTELRIPIVTFDRVVRLHLRGLDSTGYGGVKIVHESGRKAFGLGRADGEHMLMLPPGGCVATLSRKLADGQVETLQHVFTISEAVEQDVTWDVAASR